MFWISFEYLRKMEAHAALIASQSQFGAHRVPTRVLRQFQIVHARHHRWQIIVCALIQIQCLSYNGQRWIVGFKAAGWQARRTGDKLQEQTLLFACIRTENFVEIAYGRRFG